MPVISIETFDEVTPRPLSARGVYGKAVVEFMESDKKTLKITLTNPKETNSCCTAVNHIIKEKDLNAVVWKKNCSVYVIKAESN